MERIKKERKKEIMNLISKAGNAENYEVCWNDKGIPEVKSRIQIKKGKKSRTSGSRFELKVRKDLEKKGRIVDKWNNNVDLEKGEMIIAKRKFNPFLKAMTLGTGFPDFIAIKHLHTDLYSVIGVEVKMNGLLSKEEKEKCAWYLEKKIFSAIWIAKEIQGEKKKEISYEDFIEKYGNKYNKI
jgi:hypothetical protein